MQVVSPIKDVPSDPRLVKTFKQGHNGKATNLDLLNQPFPRHLGLHIKIIPNAVFDIRLVPLFMIEDFVITFDPNGPQCDATKEVHILICFQNFFHILSLNIVCFQ